MADAKLSKLFDRYRTKSDLGALAEVFDEVSPELLRVARHIAGRGVDPEDLVQATFLAAIERASVFDAERALVPWLVGILVNQSRLTKRRRGLNLPEEAAASIAAAEPALPDAESREIDEAVTRALGSLPEMYREVLVPHIADGKKPHEIARDLGRPQGTVRAQIHRGIRLMRKALPAGFALGAIAILRPNALAAVRERVLREAARRTGQGPSAIEAADLARKGRALRHRIYAGATGAAVIGALWFAWPSSANRGASEADLARTQADVRAQDDLAAPGRAEASTRAALASAPKAATAAVASADPFGSVLVHVVRGVAKAPAAGVKVTLIPWGDAHWFEAVAEGRTGADGDIAFGHVHAGRVGVHVDHGVQLRYDVLAGQETRVEAATEKGIAVHAIVVDTHGRAVPGAVVEVYADREDAPRLTSPPAEEHGAVDLADVDPRFWVAARAPGCAPSRFSWLGNPTHASDANPAVITLVVTEDAPSFEGRVVDEDGGPVVGAALRIRAAYSDLEAASDVRWTAGGGVESGLPATVTRSADRGQFRADVALAPAMIVRADAPGFAAFAARIERNGDGFDPLRVVLRRASTVHGVMHYPDGSLAPSAAIVIDARPDSPRLSAQCDARGEFELLDVAPGRHTIRARAGGIGPEVVQTIVVDSLVRCEWNGVVEHPETIEGRAIGEDGRPVRTWLVLATPENEGFDSENDAEFLGRWTRARVRADTRGQLLQAWSSPDGSFVVPCVSGSTHRLELRPRGAWRGPVQANLAGVRAGAHDVVMRVKLMRGDIEGELVDDAGKPIGPATVIATSKGLTGEATVAVDAQTGHFEINLQPGAYDLVVWPREGEPRHLGRSVLAGGERLSLGTRVLPACGALEVSDAREASLEPEVWSPAGLRASLVCSAQGAWVAAGLPPGEYRVVLLARGDRVERRIDVAPRQTARLRLQP
jgi:RNA polymerase sigma-70 factor, ECF subfamily